ncbi:LAFE_0E08746g1_1 [Lachancea fermentati]|uniref:LAFE_0E08746g1_1 n=1 Tax=Lachancea fermentati TaxID=4955 RepID=A0A1G4MDL1_LACFM|nr:LAFE_0E08746g1_1 [Lachancea fermentati]
MINREQRGQVDNSVKFIREHHFKDTFALLIVFLSFNHFASLCLLSVFIIATKSKNFLATCFIKIFLSRRLSTAATCEDLALAKPTTSKKGQQGQSPDKKRPSTISFPILIFELFVAGIFNFYARYYFTRPIENLAMSIVASSLINDPRDCLSYATSCSILYGILLNLIKRVMIFFDLQFTSYSILKNAPLYKWKIVSEQHPLLEQLIPYSIILWSWCNRLVRYGRYFASFHIVLYQFHQNMTNPYYYQSNSGRETMPTSPSSAPMSPNNSSTVGGPTISSSASTASGAIGTPHLNNAIPSTVPIAQKPIFTNVVLNYELSELPIDLPAESNSQTIATNVTVTSTGSQNSKAAYTNQFFEVDVALPEQSSKESRVNTHFISTLNLENFISQLFRWKNHHLIPPLWSIFATIKTMTFERRQVKNREDGQAMPPSETDNAPQNITPTSSNTVLNGSVFTGTDSSDCMALIAPAADDYNQLHLLPFNPQEYDYRVCVAYIGPTIITFHIKNLFEGELIVLVNGVIWSQVSSAIVSEKLGEEYSIVSGLVPSCSYDIQFVNRFNENEDYLIADLMVRTSAKNGESKEPLDFSFPSYYHRKFLSPLLTLKHSVLTTNTNLAEERAKLKKTKKEISKKFSSLRQETDHFKSKISQNVSQDEKSASKLDNLKTILQQSEAHLARLESELREMHEEELKLESEYLQKKDYHLKKQMEYGKMESSLKNNLLEAKAKLTKTQQELFQSSAKKEKLFSKQEKLQKEVAQFTEDFENFKSQFLAKRENDRKRREEMRAIEANDYELKIKGLEQDISRIEDENGTMQDMNLRYQ